MSTTAATAPWWYVAALAGSFTLLGGLISLAGGWLSDKRKLRREDQRQWDRDISDLCVQMMQSSRRVLDLKIVADDAEVEAARKNRELDSEYENHRAIRAKLKLIAPDEMYRAAQRLGRVSFQFSRSRRGFEAILNSEVTHQDYYDSRKQLVEATRRALRISMQD